MDEYALSDYDRLLYAIDCALEIALFEPYSPPYRCVAAPGDIFRGLDRLRTHFPDRPHPPFQYADLSRAARGRVDALRALTNEALDDDPEIYMNRPYDAFQNNHHLLRAFFDADFDVNTARIPPLFFVMERARPAYVLRLLLWARPEIRDRPFAFYPDPWISRPASFHGLTALQRALYKHDRESVQLLVSAPHGPAAAHDAFTHRPPNLSYDGFAHLDVLWREFITTPAYEGARALPPAHALDAFRPPR